MYNYRTRLPKTWEEGSKLFEMYRDNGFSKNSYKVRRLKRKIKEIFNKLKLKLRGE